jgi:competence protein ComEA
VEPLPGIGPVIAKRLVEGRPYWSVDQIAEVRGIGRKRLKEIRALIGAE